MTKREGESAFYGEGQMPLLLLFRILLFSLRSNSTANSAPKPVNLVLAVEIERKTEVFAQFAECFSQRKVSILSLPFSRGFHFAPIWCEGAGNFEFGTSTGSTYTLRTGSLDFLRSCSHWVCAVSPRNRGIGFETLRFSRRWAAASSLS